MAKINVKETEIAIINNSDNDYISITDIAKYKTDDASAAIGNWMRNRNTIEFLGLWEIIHNPNFKPLEFEGFKKEAGLNAFTMSPQKWISSTSAVGFISKSGRFGGLMLKEISLSNLRVGFQLSLNFILLKNSSDLKKKNKNKLVGLLKEN